MKTYCLIKNNECFETMQFEEAPKLSSNKPQWKELVDPGAPSITENN